MIPKRRIFDLIAKRRQVPIWFSVQSLRTALSLVHNSCSLSYEYFFPAVFQPLQISLGQVE